MNFHKLLLFFSLLILTCNLASPQKALRETTIHKNVKLIEMAMPQDMPEELKAKYQAIMPVFEEVLAANTTDQAPENEITFRITPDIKEIGAAKTKRIIVRVVAFRRNSTLEFVGNLLLHSYTTGENVTRKEIETCLKIHLLEPLNMK